MLLVLGSVSTGMAQSTDEPATPGEVVRQPLVIVVNRDSAPATLTVTQKMPVRDFGDEESVFEWPVDEARSRAVHDLNGHEVTDNDGKPLSLSREKTGVLTLDWSTEKLSKANPAQVTVTVQRPGALKPGAYRADIRAELNSLNEPGGTGVELSRPVKVRWPVFVFVAGRSVKTLTFDEKTPRVGFPASLMNDLQTVGSTLGEGKLSLDMLDNDKQPQLAWHVLLNQKNFKRAFIDPERVFHGDKLQGVNENWKLTPLKVALRTEAIKLPGELSKAGQAVTVPRLERHVIEVTAGDCYEPGILQAKVEWPQAPESPTAPKVDVQQSIRTTVLPGIRVFPRLAAEYETVAVMVIANGELPKQFALKAAGPQGAEISFDVTELPGAGVAGQTLSRQFYGTFTPTGRGVWTIGWPRAEQLAKASEKDRKLYKTLEEQVGQPTSVDVCFQWGSNLDTPLEVFASHEPMWWPFYFWNPLKATGWEHTRPAAIEFATHPDSLKLARVSPAGWLEVHADGRRLPYDAEAGTGPKMSVQPGVDPASSPATSWIIPDKGSLALNATVSLHPKEPIDPERHKTGVRSYVWTGVLTGQDVNNRPVARIVEIPIDVVVTNSWYYDVYLYMAGGAIILIVALVVTMNLYRTKRSKGQTTTRAAAATTSADLAMSEEERFFSTSSPARDFDEPRRSSSPLAGKDTPAGAPPPASEPEPPQPNDNPNDYFS